jgi:hypothetical protein
MNDSSDGQLVRERAAGALNRRLATLSLATVDILTLKIRLLIASVDKAQEIGINWWQSDPALSSQAKALTEERDELKARIERLEQQLGMQDDQPQRLPQTDAAAEERSESE